MDHRDTLGALKRLEKVLDDLKGLILRCPEEDVIPSEDEDQYAELISEARTLYGSVAELVGDPRFVQFGQTFDAFQHILAIPFLTRIFHPVDGSALWYNCYGVARSVVQQAIGKVEAEARREGALHPEAVARWRWLILGLEAARQAAIRPLLRLRSLLRSGIEKIESSLTYRLLAIGTVLGTCILLVVGLLALVGVL